VSTVTQTADNFLKLLARVTDQCNKLKILLELIAADVQEAYRVMPPFQRHDFHMGYYTQSDRVIGNSAQGHH
jgi:hypothetical protein